ncbi:MAG TPA: iron-sulfur cluster assembly scaffold protein [Myxococcota bacterium]|nr:iron-sulfur cluster assembly scaffold protein [Myxococcota bacterium]HNZ02951.1 iron-sulfur cluster assembly scaffold protein [Myxococcota bacterium]HOD07167.1 iron-sulfur cluster assembly scaffold protein [Myxococcota bacterium]HPB49991.1 iron-sulfur cluster assembly scaffold protein [Myxococcota bacterium]HQP95007.1 iron-sulfur cluster assembly scaffold protein [Myxococcota bacterium]
MPWDYSEKVLQLFRDAMASKAGTHMGAIEDPDGIGSHGSLSCGDALEFAFKVDRNQDPRLDRIVQARYRTFGCTSAIASSEALCALIEEKGLTPIEALKITNADIVDYLDGLPAQKLHCSVMGAEALQAAVADWAAKRGVPLEELGLDTTIQKDDEGRIVCRCFNLTEPFIRRKVRELNLHSIADITNAIKAGGACTACHHEPGGLQDILDDIWGREDQSTMTPQPLPPTSSSMQRTPFQLSREIDRVVESDIRPRLQKQGGDIEIVEIRGKKVFCRLLGGCQGCSGAPQTLRLVVEDSLRSKVDAELEIISI